MTRDIPTILLVSHGQPSDPQPAEMQIRRLARSVQAELPQANVRGVTLAAEGVFEQELLQAHNPLILPFFMADGYFTSRVLPRRIGEQPAQILPAFGLHPELPQFTADWLNREMALQGWKPSKTTLFLAGHGSGRSARPAEVTNGFAQSLAERIEFAEIHTGFVEQSPFLKESAKDLPAQSICLPFFALERGHVLEDLPEALDATDFQGLRLAPFGSHPDLPVFLAQCLQENLRT